MGLGSGAGVAEGSGDGDGSGLGAGVGSGEADPPGTGVGPSVAAGAGVGAAVGVGVAVGVGDAVGSGCGVGSAATTGAGASGPMGTGRPMPTVAASTAASAPRMTAGRARRAAGPRSVMVRLSTAGSRPSIPRPSACMCPIVRSAGAGPLHLRLGRWPRPRHGQLLRPRHGRWLRPRRRPDRPGTAGRYDPRVSTDPRVIVAVDVGTSALKAAILAADGTIRGRARVPLHLVLDGERGIAEQDARDWWSALVHGVRESIHAARSGGPLAPLAICVVGHGPTLVPTAADGTPVGPAVTWLDQRSGADVAEVAARIGRRGWTVALLGGARRIARLDPGRDAATAWYLSSWDHLAFRLTGVAAAALQDPADAITPVEAATVGLDARAAPPPARAGRGIGGLTHAPAEALGLPPDLPVVAGVNDAIAAFLGAGLTEAGQAIDTGGTSGGFGLYVAGAPVVPGLWAGAAPIPGIRYVGGAMAGTGKALDWLADGALGGAVPVATLLADAGSVAPGADGLVFLPYLAGERWPLHDPTARGAFVGLTLAHGRGHLARAVLEAAAFALRHVAAPAVAAGLPFVELRSVGGPAASRTWCQAKADVLDVPVVVPAETDASLVGAAVLAAVGGGAFADEREAMAALVRATTRLEPRPATRATYDGAYAVYEELGTLLAGPNAALGLLDAAGGHPR